MAMKMFMQLFNKILKPPFAYLREQGSFSVIHVDDTLFGSDEFDECQANVTKILQWLENLAFFVYPDKSIFIPTQNIIFFT